MFGERTMEIPIKHFHLLKLDNLPSIKISIVLIHPLLKLDMVLLQISIRNMLTLITQEEKQDLI